MQELQRKLMSLCVQWMSPFREFLDLGVRAACDEGIRTLAQIRRFLDLRFAHTSLRNRILLLRRTRAVLVAEPLMDDFFAQAQARLMFIQELGEVSPTTAAQVATIIAQRNAVLASSVSGAGSSQPSVGERVPTEFSDGGYTARRSNDYEAVGIVHANEWVAPAAMVRANPITFATLENMRRSGNFHSGAAGYANGGTVGAVSPASALTAEQLELIRQTRDVMQKILDSLPFPTYLVLSQANAVQELDRTIKNIVGK